MKRKRKHFADVRSYARFKDTNCKHITIQDSSVPACAWIFLESGVSAAHLTVSMAKHVIKALQKFLAVESKRV